MIENNPTSNLEGNIAAPVKRHSPALPLERLPELLSRIDSYHQERNCVRAAYNHKAEYLEARRTMVQWWSDYLDMCRKAYASPYICGKKMSCTMGYSPLTKYTTKIAVLTLPPNPVPFRNKIPTRLTLTPS